MNIFEISQQYFCCPICKSELELERIGKTGDGLLQCRKCTHNYLVLDNIPVMLPFSYVEAEIRNTFFKKNPQYKSLFGNIAGETDDHVKKHQIKTWGEQYDRAKNVTFSIDRYIPQAREVERQNLFYKNSRKVLYEVVRNKRENNNNGIFLDIGCGGGSFTYLGSQNFKLYFGMDISFNAIIKCCSEFPFKNCIFFVGNAESIPLKPSIIDVCGAQWLFEHLSNPQKCADEMFRVLSPDKGCAYIDTNHKKFLLTYRWCQMVFTPKYYWHRMEEAGHSHDRFFDRLQIQNIFKKSGFSRINSKLCYFLMDMFLSNKIMAPLFQTIKNYFRKHSRKYTLEKIKERLNNKLIDFDNKEEFISISSRTDHLKKIYNLLIEFSYYLLFIDRLLEFFGHAESIILVAEKNRDLLFRKQLSL